MLKSDDFLSFTLRSVRVECVRGEKSSTGGIGQLFLQQLRQRWGRRQDRVCDQWYGHHGDHHHGGRQGDHSAHSGRQKWEGSLQQVDTLMWNDVQLLCVGAVCPLSYCTFKCFYRPLLSLFPSKLFSPHNFTSTFSVFLLISPSSCVSPPLSSPLDSRVFRPAVRRYVVLEVLCSGVWNVFLKLYEGFKKAIMRTDVPHVFVCLLHLTGCDVTIPCAITQGEPNSSQKYTNPQLVTCGGPTGPLSLC